jgi:DNA-binding MarR family transcriptional regulator
VFSERDPVDRRVVRIRLSEPGRELRRRVLEHRRRDLEALAAPISFTPTAEEDLRRLALAFEAFS